MPCTHSISLLWGMSAFLLAGFDLVVFVILFMRARSCSIKAGYVILLSALFGLLWMSPDRWLHLFVICFCPVARLLYCLVRNDDSVRRELLGLSIVSTIGVLVFFALKLGMIFPVDKLVPAQRHVHQFSSLMLFAPIMLFGAVGFTFLQKDGRLNKQSIVFLIYYLGSLIWFTSLVDLLPRHTSAFVVAPLAGIGVFTILLFLHVCPWTRDALTNNSYFQNAFSATFITNRRPDRR